jgi:hypothetical protein
MAAGFGGGLFLDFSKLLEHEVEFRTYAFELFAVRGGEPAKDLLTARGKLNEHLPAVLG